MRHPKLVEFEKRLKKLFDEVDAYLEERYGGLYPLHPARAETGSTSNPEHDGLFNVGASFSPGFGSSLGKGYVIQVEMITLAPVHEEKREAILQDAASRIEELLGVYFPERTLQVDRDGTVFKIHGNLSLGSL